MYSLKLTLHEIQHDKYLHRLHKLQTSKLTIQYTLGRFLALANSSLFTNISRIGTNSLFLPFSNSPFTSSHALPHLLLLFQKERHLQTKHFIKYPNQQQNPKQTPPKYTKKITITRKTICKTNKRKNIKKRESFSPLLMLLPVAVKETLSFGLKL